MMHPDWETGEIVVNICCLIGLLILLIISYRLNQRVLIPNADSPVVSLRRPYFTMLYLNGSIFSALIGSIIVAVSMTGHVRNQFALWVASRCTLYIGHFSLMALRMWILLHDLHQTRTEEDQHIASRLHLKGAFSAAPYTPHQYQISPQQMNSRALWSIIAWNLCLLIFPLVSGQHIVINVEWTLMKNSITFRKQNTFH